MTTHSAPRRLGFVVNPIAGMGGRVALKGTDGAEALALARARGAEPVAPRRAAQALATLAGGEAPLEILAAPGALGGDIAAAAGLDVTLTSNASEGDTTAADTRAAVSEMRERGVDLVLFAGGDGTARDILDAIGDALPLVGVPTGVKMHSGVFAATPAAAGAAAAAYLRDPDPAALRDGEVADVDEDATRAGRISTRLYGSVRVPRAPALMVAAKAAPRSSGDLAVDALCRQLARTLDPGRLTLVGPGSTTARLLSHLGLKGTLLGVDAVRHGELVASDLDEAGLLALLDDDDDRRSRPSAATRWDGASTAARASDAPATLICGVVGGQGALFGRGNQQLSPRVLRRLGHERIQVIAAADKLLRLDPPALRVDTGDDALDAELSRYMRVHVAPGRTIVMRVST
ncbi:ATP-NAD kinase family protein [Conexibacter sp. CPCC 206217]|uniref:ATP-NAD kinase family protein n=1 Tax=Conexibacter sp. CPCC 206217 TaxID=3064574 RepID=UPI0027249981|nr:NAD(+)/NADH kinase [Conexibacter sp. CPCC 206217]MDO8209034.1 NAD(+)/NADH kinase [Conexibacter sp. CPCC 206217]